MHPHSLTHKVSSDVKPLNAPTSIVSMSFWLSVLFKPSKTANEATSIQTERERAGFTGERVDETTWSNADVSTIHATFVILYWDETITCKQERRHGPFPTRGAEP